MFACYIDIITTGKKQRQACMKVLFELFISFFRTGLFTFGGGYAMLPLLRQELVTEKKWLSEDELLNYFSIGGCTPGIIAINVATFCGYKLKKSIGAVVATTAVVLPSMIVIILIASSLNKIETNQSILHIFNGVKIGVAALLIKVVYDLSRQIYFANKRKLVPAVIFLCAVSGLTLMHLSSVKIIIGVFFTGGVLTLLKRRLK